jgi:hypothetical protein
MHGLLKSGLIHEEVAERYRMTPMEVRHHVEAANLMDRIYFPITRDPSDAEHRSKFSYFLEFLKNARLRNHAETIPDLPERFARWVRDGLIDTGMKVRKLPKVLDLAEALQLLEVEGFEAAEDYISKGNPREHELYLTFEKARMRLQQLTVTELIELAGSPERTAILNDLKDQIATVLETAGCFADGRGRAREGRSH